MTSQMVFILLVKKTTPITVDMLKSTCPKMSNEWNVSHHVLNDYCPKQFV
jgi:hypothetical protein